MDSLENIEKEYEQTEYTEAEGLNPLQIDYLRELKIAPEVWESMDLQAQDEHLGLVMHRFQELKLPRHFNLKQWIDKIFGFKVKESYERIEAPQDHIQIEQISKALSDCKELRFENWCNLEFSERMDVLNSLEARIAEIEHRPACPVNYNASMGGIQIYGDNVYGHLGGYSQDTKDITLNANMVESNDPTAYLEVIDTIVHEGRHAYQDYNIHVCEIHPRHSEVASWAETMGDGKWRYWGDCSTELGQRLYEQQSVEIDARNFAADIKEKITDKLFA